MINEELENKLSAIRINKNDTILFALNRMDEAKRKLLLVYDDKQFFSLVSIGDIQRAILHNVSLNSPVLNILRKGLTFSYEYENVDSIKNRMLKHRTECMPVLNEKKQLVNIYFWDDFFGKEKRTKKTDLKLPVVIMAGGKGKRLKPITNVIPKPLIPIGEKTIIEEIMDRFVQVGCNEFYLSVNYKAETIKHYFKQLKSTSYNIKYFQEDQPLGTAGSLFLIKEKIKSTFFVSNCDIIIDEDYSEILEYHQENKNELTIISSIKQYPIPYGTIETQKNGILVKFIEKPDLVFQINSGMYILEPHLLKEIPNNKFFHITDLIENIQKRNGRVGVFPVSEGSWKDIGEWDQYLQKLGI